MSFYVDVHCHLTHKAFASDYHEVLDKAKKSGLGAIVVNGLEPESNRKILEMAKKDPIIKPALGIYPLEAVCDIIPDDLPFKVKKFNVSEEIAFIRTHAEQGKLAAIGECGLDGYWVKEETFPGQEKVFEELLDIAKSSNIPVIIHSRKLEKRTIEVVEHHKNEKVVFHCFGGKSKLAINTAEKHGWCFSIPATAHKNQGFMKLLQKLPEECLLTETDAPYLSPEKNTRNEPSNVLYTVDLLAKARTWSADKARDLIYFNYLRLFSYTPKS